MRCSILMAAISLFIGCGRAPLEALAVGRDVAADARDVVAPPDVGSRGDARPFDTGRPDVFNGECSSASECPGPAQICEDPRSCKCGCFKSCFERSCVAFCDDSPECFAQDAGAPSACRRASDCPSVEPSRFCFGTGGASCAFGACTPDCEAGRSCAIDTAGCVRCERPGEPPARAACPTCTMLPFRSGAVEESSCDFAPIRTALRFSPRRDCRFSLTTEAGAQGELTPLDDGTGLARLDGVGMCLVQQAATGAFRTIWSCPGCGFTVIHR